MVKSICTQHTCNEFQFPNTFRFADFQIASRGGGHYKTEETACAFANNAYSTQKQKIQVSSFIRFRITEGVPKFKSSSLDPQPRPLDPILHFTKLVGLPLMLKLRCCAPNLKSVALVVSEIRRGSQNQNVRHVTI